MTDGGQKKVRRRSREGVEVRIVKHATIEAYSSGEVVARFSGYMTSLGAFGSSTTNRVKSLQAGIAIEKLAHEEDDLDKDMGLLVQRLSQLNLLEFTLPSSQNGKDGVVVEPQVRGYWPQIPRLKNSDTLILSRFAYLRRRNENIVLESPRASALFKFFDSETAAFIVSLSKPRRLDQLKKMEFFPGTTLLALLVESEIAVRADADAGFDLAEEKDSDLALWEFHDLLMHTRSTGGRHTNPIGSAYPHIGQISPLPAARPRWPGDSISLETLTTASLELPSSFTRLLDTRTSVRSFDETWPIAIGELAQFLFTSARVLPGAGNNADAEDGGAAFKPYPSAGASYELELYLAVNQCEGLSRGFYHYDASANALMSIDVSGDDLKLLLSDAKTAMGAVDAPQILITIAARFGRVSWKYSSIAYSLVLKDVGVLTQTFYLTSTDMKLGGCAIGVVNIDLFAKMTGVKFYAEGPVGQFALGRPKPSKSLG